MAPVDVGDCEMPKYQSKEEWYKEDIYLTNPCKGMLEPAGAVAKEEKGVRDILKECESLLNRKTNVHSL